MRDWIHRRGPLCAYLLIVLTAFLLLSVATKPIINHYVNRKIQEVLHTGQVCREGVPDEVESCRQLINRITHAATAKQEHDTAVRLFRTLSGKEIHELGLQGPRGRRGAPGVTKVIRITLPGKIVTITETVPGKTGPRGPQGPRGPKGSTGKSVPEANNAPRPTPGQQPGTPSPNNPPGPIGNPNSPPCPAPNPHC